MILKIPKSITGIARQLISLLLVMVVSLTLLTSPALAANSVILTNDNYEDVVLRAEKPVIVVLAAKSALEDFFGTSLEDLKTKADDYFDDKFKVAVGNIEESLEISYRVPIMANGRAAKFRVSTA
jgi:gamma-glutamylcysteine synthetase